MNSTNLNNHGTARPLPPTLRGWRSSGFTLVELIVVVAIVGILAAIAYPSYLDQVRKGYRAEAQALLMELAQRQQNFLIIRRRYASSLQELGYAGTGGDALSSTLQQVAQSYDIAGLSMGVSGALPPSFNIVLSPLAGSLQAGDGSLCLSNTGARWRYCSSMERTPW